MSYIGKSPAVAALTASDITDGIISNAKLAQDIMSAETALAVAPADSDEFLLSDSGVLKRIDYSLIKASPGRVLIKEIDASDVAAVTFVHGTSDVVFDTTYDLYELRWSNLLVAGDEQLNLRALSGGSVLTSGYYINDYGAVDGSASVSASTTMFFETHGDADTAEPFFGVAWLTNVGVSSSKPCSYGQFFHERSTGVHASKSFSGVYDTAISDFDGVTITNLGGPNIASGKFKLYGIN